MTFDPDYDIATPAVRQTTDWTCAACSWAWLATAIGHPTTEWEAIQIIGEPEHINWEHGLMDSSGSRLSSCYSATPRSWPSHFSQINWSDAVGLARHGPLLMGGRGWYHWTAVRGEMGSLLWLANPAPYYFGVGDQLDRDQFDQFGPWAAVWLAGARSEAPEEVPEPEGAPVLRPATA